MKYGSVCSGIEAATVAWHPLGWQPQFFSEIEKFPCALLKHHFPSVPNYGDMTKFKEWPDVGIDLLVGGTPCQAFSVAGLRQGLADPRGNLALVYLGVVDKYRPRWVVWENVPGVLSSSGGRDLGAFLGALGELGYGWAYRVLDAQHFGVPQRRRRVFVVGHLGDWRRPAAVLFERESLRGDSAEGDSKGAQVARTITTGTGKCYDADTEDFVVGTLQVAAGHGRGWRLGADEAAAGHVIPIAFAENSRAEVRLEGGDGQIFGALKHGGGKPGQSYPAVLTHRARRLTPRECERLQGFPDDWTLIPIASDSVRYKAIGNSMAVPCMRWIGEGIAEVDCV